MAEDVPRTSSGETDAEARRRRVWWIVSPIVILAALALRFSFYFGGDLARSIAVLPQHGLTEDQKLVVALTSSNVENWTDHARGLFQLDQCFPFDNALALGETMWTGSLLGLPVSLFTGEPVAIANGVILMTSLCAILAMVWLVIDWTGQPAAGLAVGLLYALLGTRTWDPVHIFAWDTTWTVLALLFARRLFESPRWRDAIGLALSLMMQLGASIYPTLGAFLVALPFVPWLFVRRGLARAPWLHLAVVAAAVLGFVAWLFAPYFALESSGELSTRSMTLFLGVGALAPGSPFSPGWLLGALILIAAWPGVGRTGDVRSGDVRWVLAIAIALVLFSSLGVMREGGFDRREELGKDGFPVTTEPTWIYRVVQTWVPGAAVVRFPAAMYGAAHMGFCILGGLGAGALIRRSGRHRHAVEAGLVGAAFVTVTVGGIRWELAEIRPSESALAFYDELAALGNTGPILDLPAGPRIAMGISSADYALLSAYHHRPTSGCYNSFIPEQVVEVRRWAGQVPRDEAVAVLRSQGFTTAIVHHPPGNELDAALLARVSRRALVPGSQLRLIHATEERSAFELLEPDASGHAEPETRPGAESTGDASEAPIPPVRPGAP